MSEGWETGAMEFVLIAVAILVVALITGISLLVGRGRRTVRLDSDAAAGTTLTRPRPPATDTEPPAPSGATAVDPTSTAEAPPAPPVELPPAEPEPGLVFETPPPSAGRLVRLRSRLARSQSSLGRGLLTVLGREELTEDDWEGGGGARGGRRESRREGGGGGGGAPPRPPGRRRARPPQDRASAAHPEHGAG